MKNYALKLSVALAICLAGIVSIHAEEKPFTIPEIREWAPAEGEFTFAKKVRVVYPASDGELRIAAEVLAENINLSTGIKAKAKAGAKVRKGDVQIVTGDKPEEGYGIDISDRIVITVSTRRGAVWAGSTILQIAERREGFTLPCGSIEDWPEYGIRGRQGTKFLMQTLVFPLETAGEFKSTVTNLEISNN